MKLFGISGMQYIVIFASLTLVYFIMREMEVRETVDKFSEMIEMLEQWINDPEDVILAQHKQDINDHIKRLWATKGLRFTLIRGDGVVLLDGAHHHLDMDNQLSRSEVQDALVEGRGVAIRKSDTLGKMMLYVAEPFKTPWGTLYLRLASSPDMIRKNHMVYIMLAIIAVTCYLVIQLC